MGEVPTAAADLCRTAERGWKVSGREVHGLVIGKEIMNTPGCWGVGKARRGNSYNGYTH